MCKSSLYSILPEDSLPELLSGRSEHTVSLLAVDILLFTFLTAHGQVVNKKESFFTKKPRFSALLYRTPDNEV